MRTCIIGCGGMGGALVRGLAGRADFALSVYDRHADKVAVALGGASAKVAHNLKEAVQDSEVIVLCVKPHATVPLLREVARLCDPAALLVSVAAGVTLAAMAEAAPTARLSRAMPNTGAQVQKSTTAVVLGPRCDEAQDRPRAKMLFEAVGSCGFLTSEESLHAVIGLAGSGPAFVLALADAMLSAGVNLGLKREEARLYAAGAFTAAAALLEQTGKDPSALVAEITSPGGTTIEGLRALTEKNGADAIWSAVSAAAEKSRAMSKS